MIISTRRAFFCILFLTSFFACFETSVARSAQEETDDSEPLVRVVDLDLDEKHTVTLTDGTETTVQLVGLKETP